MDIVHAFWDEVWNAHDPAAADRFVVDDFVIVTAGGTISGADRVAECLTKHRRVIGPCAKTARLI